MADPRDEMEMKKWARKKEKMQEEHDSARDKLHALVSATMAPKSASRKAILRDLQRVIEDKQISTFNGAQSGASIDGLPDSEKHAVVTGLEPLPWEGSDSVRSKISRGEQVLREMGLKE